jgi:hypothetical protein
VKGERIGRKSDRRRNLSGLHAVRSRLDQEPIRLQAMILGKRGQRGDGMGLFHISTNIES